MKRGKFDEVLSLSLKVDDLTRNIDVTKWCLRNGMLSLRASVARYCVTCASQLIVGPYDGG